jgi:hypothetical protein
VWISYGSYYMWKNDLNISDAKKQLWVVDKVQKTDTSRYVESTKEDKESSEISSDIKTQSKTVDISREESLIDFDNLPIWVDFWTPVSLGATKFTYSDLKWLEVNAGSFAKEDINCENITDFLGNSLNTWFYWNTCRNVVSNDDGISFYVIKLSDDKKEYIYEKHYILYNKWLHGVYEIVSWISVDEENIALDIQAQHSVLKEKHDDFAVLEVVDSLFKKIIK